jgi:hypothetical protein
MGVGLQIHNIRSLQKSFRDDIYKTTLEQKKQQVKPSEKWIRRANNSGRERAIT